MTSSQFKDSPAADLPPPPSPPRRGLLRRLAAGLAGGLGARRGTRSAADLTTLPAPTRGQAMREAHRTLRARMQGHPAIREVLPHLSVIERALAKKGSRALLRLPLPVLKRGLEQLAVLQREDETPAESLNLRVLRLRLIEAVARRSTPASEDFPQPGALAAGDDQGMQYSGDSATPWLLSSGGVEVSDLSSSAFDDAELGWGNGAGKRHSTH